MCHLLQRFKTPYFFVTVNLLHFPNVLPTKHGFFTGTTLIEWTVLRKTGLVTEFSYSIHER